MAQNGSSDNVLKKIFHLVADTIGWQWQRLGLLLGVPESVLEDIELGGSTRKIYAKAYDMLKSWKNLQDWSDCGWIYQLMTHLKEVARHDIEREVRKRWEAHSSDNGVADDERFLTNIFDCVAESINADWRRLGSILGVSDDALDNIDPREDKASNKAAEMLKAWGKLKKSEPFDWLAELINQLEKVGRNDIVRKIRKLLTNHAAPPMDMLAFTKESYNVDRFPRGKCLIVNNYYFDKPPNDRVGSELDMKYVEKIFQWLGFQTEVFKDLTAEEMGSALERSAKEDHSNYAAFACVIMSHGSYDCVLGVDGKAVDFKKIRNDFKIVPSLMDKPKLFVIQACQNYNSADSASLGTFECSEDVRVSLRPAGADTLFSVATVPGELSWRNPNTGSWFIQSLCNKLKEMAFDCHMLEILTAVSRDVSQRCAVLRNGAVAQQIPPFTSTLDRVLYFRPQKSFEDFISELADRR